MTELQEPTTGKDLMRILDDERVKDLSERSKICMNALAGVKDPEAFMRDVRFADVNHRGFREGRLNRRPMLIALEDIAKHLKGGE